METTKRPKRRRPKGAGSLKKRGNMWWLRIRMNGVVEERSTGFTNYNDALNLLNDRLAEVRREGTKTLVKADKLTVRDLLERVRVDYEINARASLLAVVANVKAWEQTPLIDAPAVSVGYDDLQQVAAQWQRHERGAGRKVTNATINRRLATLQRGYSLARKAGKLTVLPIFPHLEESGRLVDRFSRAEVEAVCSHLPEDYADFFEFATCIGIRKGQLAATLWNMVNADSWSITWPAELCKKRKPHTVYLDDRALEIVQKRWEARRLDCPFVFNREGQPIGEIKKTLKRAFAEVGLVYGRRTGRTFHGTRRTAVTNLVESGVPRSVAKEITGHSTDQMFGRYAIHEGEAQRAALKRAGAFVAAQPTTPKVVPIRSAG